MQYSIYIMKNTKKLILGCSLLFLTSCVETAVLGGLTGGVLVTRDKSFVDTKDDIAINARLAKEFLDQSLTAIDVIVYEGRVMLTGVVTDPKKARKAVDIAWNINGVKEVIDEIQIVKNRSLIKKMARYSNDAAITTQIESQILFKKNVASLNYKVTTVNGIVYLIGVGQNSSEIKRVADLCAKVSGVKKVVSHVILVDDKRRKED
jgi:osmotically-inducible protein OsmY